MQAQGEYGGVRGAGCICPHGGGVSMRVESVHSGFYSARPHEHHPGDERVEEADGVHGQRFAGGHEHVREKTGRRAGAPAAAQDNAAGSEDKTDFSCT